MKSIKLSILAIILLSLSLLAAEGWELDSDVMVNLSQGIYSDNWSGTEKSTVTWVAQSNSAAQKQLKDWLHNKTTLKLAFGQTHTSKGDPDGDGKTEWGTGEKSTDKIDLETLFRFTLQSFVDPYAALKLESQFIDKQGADTYFVNPMLFTESAGIMKSIVDLEKTKFSVRLGGAVRERIDRGPADNTIDGGAEAVAELKKIIGDSAASYNSRLSAYKAFFNSKSDDLNDDWKATDLKWENMLSTKLWGFLSANLSLDLQYDKEQAPGWQWKEILGLGFSYSLF